MKALVKLATEAGHLEIQDVPIPSPGRGQVLVEVVEAGICGSDLHIYHSDIAIPLRPPVTIGHEFSGVVAALGDGVEAFSPGDRVVSETAFAYCGVCHHCLQGYYNLCDDRKTLGYWHDGVFARYTVLPAARLMNIPDVLGFTAAAMSEPLACVVHAVDDISRIQAGDRVLVSGPGSIGLLALQTARAKGAHVIVAGTAIDAERLETARRLGADDTVRISERNLTAAVMDFSDGKGVDVVLECSGSPVAIDDALSLVKKRGFFTQIGLPGRRIDFDIEKICYREIHFSGSLGSRRANWIRALELASSGEVELESLVTSKRPITAWKSSFDDVEKKRGIKAYLLPVD